MEEELRHLQKEIEKTRKYLSSLESKFHKVMSKVHNKSEERIEEIEKEFKSNYPDLPVRRELLALVGTEPYNPPSNDKEITRRITAERYD